MSDLPLFSAAPSRRAAVGLGVAVAAAALLVGGLVGLASPLIALGALAALAVAV